MICMITFNEQQIEAIKKVVKWYFVDSFHQQIFALAGYAGTGKSTVINTAVKMLGIPTNDVIFATFTAKASLVLRLKGNPSNTIHKTFYSVYKGKKSFCFSLKHRLPSNIKLIVIDEASMINQKMLEDISSFGVPIILLMDAGQIPPVFGSNVYIDNPDKMMDVQLTKVMRQDDSSGILDLAMAARRGEPLELGQHKLSLVTTVSKIIDKIHTYDMVLCYSNKNRRILNKMIRDNLGYKSVYPTKGEKVLCMMNNYNYTIEYADVPIFIINGLMSYVQEDAELTPRGDFDLLKLKFKPYFLDDNDPNTTFDTVCFREVFEQYTKDPSKEAFIEELYSDKLEDDDLEDICMLDYGYAFTVHKSQGSEYDNPLLIVDIKGKTQDFYNKWLYTGITRAKKSVTIAFLD